MKSPALVILLATFAASVGVAQAGPVAWQAECSADGAAASACVIDDKVDATGVHHMGFATSDKHHTFVGKPQTGWWSGQLDGKPAMGYERNRGHVVFSTTDLQSTFEWWSKDNEHGSY